MAFAITQNISVGSGEKLLLIAGPCQIESLNHCLKIADFVQNLIIKKDLPINFVFKASYDKANRTSIDSERGPGIEKGLDVLAKVKEQFELPILADIHSVPDASTAASVVDIIQIPAFLCRQTDLLVAAGNTKKTINVKKGQFLSPDDCKFVAEKISSTGNKKIMLCERGTCFGYRDLVVDMRGLITMKKFGYPVIFDGSHSVQSMGGSNGASGGNREFIPGLVRGACAVGVDGLFLECHDNPDKAPSDGPNMVELSNLESILNSACAIRNVSLNYCQ